MPHLPRFVYVINVNDIHVNCLTNTIKHKHSQCITVEQVQFAFNKIKTRKSD